MASKDEKAKSPPVQNKEGKEKSDSALQALDSEDSQSMREELKSLASSIASMNVQSARLKGMESSSSSQEMQSLSNESSAYTASESQSGKTLREFENFLRNDHEIELLPDGIKLIGPARSTRDDVILGNYQKIQNELEKRKEDLELTKKTCIEIQNRIISGEDINSCQSELTRQLMIAQRHTKRIREIETGSKKAVISHCISRTTWVLRKTEVKGEDKKESLTFQDLVRHSNELERKRFQWSCTLRSPNVRVADSGVHKAIFPSGSNWYTAGSEKVYTEGVTKFELRLINQRYGSTLSASQFMLGVFQADRWTANCSLYVADSFLNGWALYINNGSWQFYHANLMYGGKPIEPEAECRGNTKKEYKIGIELDMDNGTIQWLVGGLNGTPIEGPCYQLPKGQGGVRLGVSTYNGGECHCVVASATA